MKNARKIQFILTPIYVCILSVMLVVVSFSWYKISGNANIQVESNDVSIVVDAPKGINVELSPIGDNYSLSDETYTVEKILVDDKVSLTGYFGQYGNEPSPSLDKPYIVFYQAQIDVGNNDTLEVNSAYIKHSIVQKVTRDASGNVTGSPEILVDKEFANASESAYTINFYSGRNDGNIYTFTSESSTFIPDTSTIQTVYLGIKFYPTVVNTITSDNNCFLYSNIKYFGSEYVLTACFTKIDSANS